MVMYGAAEATARMGYLPPANTLAKVGAMGVAIPGGRFELSAEGELLLMNVVLRENWSITGIMYPWDMPVL